MLGRQRGRQFVLTSILELEQLDLRLEVQKTRMVDSREQRLVRAKPREIGLATSTIATAQRLSVG